MLIIQQLHKYKAGLSRILLCICVIAVVYLIDYDCMFQSFFHIPCLGCGMSRAWKCVALGQWVKAYEYHRAFYMVPIAGLYLFKGGLLFKKKLWDIVLIAIIILGFVENYLHHFFTF